MIVEIGHYALVLALFVAIAMSVIPMVGAARKDGAWMAVARPGSVVLFALVAISFAALTNAYVTSDFSVINVLENSHSAKPMIYKITGVWANHEGSMLLWIMILTLFGALVAILSGNLPPTLRARVLGIMAMISVGFLLFILFTSNPFIRVIPAPIDGRGMNPLLQDPGIALHPPFLYLGYVGMSVSFAFAVAALIEGRVDASWARWVRPWTLVAWATLTLGIALGSWWAYYELGWGGWWFWDPVENASFMPWLAATALLHSAIVVEKRDSLKTWTVLLAIVAFSLSLIGTFLVRSGVLTSVHAFAQDPDRGLFILILLLITIGGALALYAWRAPTLTGGGIFAPASREGALVFNNLLMTVSCAAVFLGTLYPLFLDAIGGGKVSVGPPYFNLTFISLMVPMVLAMAIGPLMAWKRGDLPRGVRRLLPAALVALLVGLGGWIAVDASTAITAMGLALGTWAILGALVEIGNRVGLGKQSLGNTLRRAGGLPRAAWGMSLAHIGVGVLVLAITVSSAWKEEVITVMTPGQTQAVGSYDFRFDGVTNIPASCEELERRILSGQARGENYCAERATFTVTHGDRFIGTLTPENRVYPVQNNDTTEAAIYTTWISDLYAVLGESQGESGWTVRLYYNPMVPFLWYGCLLMVLGGFVSLSDRRHRVGAPQRAKATNTPSSTQQTGPQPAAAGD